jgi:hypothetical protein
LYFGFSIGLSCQADEYKIPAQQQAVNVLMPLLACSFEMSGSVPTIEMKEIVRSHCWHPQQNILCCEPDLIALLVRGAFLFH